FFSSRRRHTRFSRDWSSDVCSSDLGVQAGEVQIDLPAVVARKDEVVGNKRAGMEARVAASPNITPYWAEARFTGPHTVEAAGERSEERRVGQERRSRGSRQRERREQ